MQASDPTMPLMPLYELDFDQAFSLDEFPSDFECPSCMMIPADMLTCKHCEQLCCRACLTGFSAKKKEIPGGQFECLICHKVDVMQPYNRIMSQILNVLKFKCQGPCKQTYPYSELITHKKEGRCRPGYVRPLSPNRQPSGPPGMGVKKSSSTAMAPAGGSRASGGFGGVNDLGGYIEQRPAINSVRFLLKDSRSILTVNFNSKSTSMTSSKEINYPGSASFPHNFQCVQNPYNGNIFLVGGGDYASDNEALYCLWEISGNNFIQRDKMKHPRHGHSACWFSEKFIVVTGSRKEKNNSQSKCEMFNADIDLWFEMPDMNVGRHYHSSCAMRDRFIYVFCGIANQSRKYINSIERYDNQTRGSWELIQMNNKIFPERQGCGAVQRDGENILIFGGFSGRFLGDSFHFNVQTNQLTPVATAPNELFLFQMPVSYDSASDSVYACDTQRHLVYRYNTHNQWTIHQSLRPAGR